MTGRWVVVGVLGVEGTLKVGVVATDCCCMRVSGDGSEGGGGGP